MTFRTTGPCASTDVSTPNIGMATSGAGVGEELHGLVAELYPICRSLTGDGVRATLGRIAEFVPLDLREVPTGTQVFDWTIPREWNVRDAYVKDASGRRVIDFRSSNLHLVGYSAPVYARMPLADLQQHLFTIPEHPDWIPYRTSYYREDWGFCLSHNTLLGLEDGMYEVCVDSTLEDGRLVYGESCLAGESADEVLISTHVCHPSLANDNLSGIAVAAFLARELSEAPRRLSYRFLFVPGTIGAIAWLSMNQAAASRIAHGLVLTGVGDGGHVTYKRSRRGNADVDRAAEHMLLHSGDEYDVVDFSPYGYDERQYCSPGFDLPVGCFMRTPWGRYPQYHTSADDLDFVRPESLADSLAKVRAVLSVLDGNATYVNLSPFGEPQLGRRGLYRAAGGRKDESVSELAMLWVLNLSDSRHSLLDIAERSGLEFGVLRTAADLLLAVGLLEEASA
jgi:aminopeptidase-like protein